MSTDTPTVKKPSEAHREATAVPVYRLSELMFGSLLAAYVLGFITGATGSGATGIVDSWLFSDRLDWIHPRFVSSLPGLLISVSFAYVTAALYLSYHAGILTMPTTPFERLRYDFALALAEAVMFGYSMLYPHWFPVLLGFTLLGAAVRQWVEHRHLTTKLYEKVVRHAASARNNDRDLEVPFYRIFRTLLRKRERPAQGKRKQRLFTHLDAWDCVRLSTLFVILSMMVLSAIIWSLLIPYSDNDPARDLLRHRALLLQTAVASVTIIWRSHSILKRRSHFFLPISVPQAEKRDMDAEFDTLIKTLTTPTQ